LNYFFGVNRAILNLQRCIHWLWYIIVYLYRTEHAKKYIIRFFTVKLLHRPKKKEKEMGLKSIVMFGY